MTPLLALFVLVAVIALVGGQIFLKHAANYTNERPIRWRPCAGAFATGIGSFTLWFFLWLYLLGKLPLSYLYPFAALSGVFISIAAMIFLREKTSLRLWMGILLIGAGVLIVSTS